MCFTGVAKKRDYSIQKLANETAIVGSADPLKDQALEQLQELIVTGELEPGSKLLETQIASRLGVSRATLREAMARLNEVGLLVYHPYRGTYVRGLYVSDLEEIFSFRTGLEKMAFQLCWNKRNLVNLADLEMRNQYLSKCISDNDAYGAIVSEYTCIVGAMSCRNTSSCFKHGSDCGRTCNFILPFTKKHMAEAARSANLMTRI